MNSSISPSTASVVDIGPLIDLGPWTASRKSVLLLCALAIVLDGLDNQILGFAMPAIIAEWGVSRSDLASTIAVGFVGMTIGTPIGGVLGDRYGRKFALIASVLLFGIATAAIAMARTPFDIGAGRFISGFGLGGALPAATALISEYTPLRRRSLSVMLALVCIPIGGMVGGLLAAQLLPSVGWRALFLISGSAPIALAILLVFILPESAEFLTARGADPNRVRRSVRALGHSVREGETYIDARNNKGMAAIAPLSLLLGDEHRRSTTALWIGFFFCLLPVYILYAWTPTLLAGEGVNLSTASFALALFNFGGIAGCLLTAWAIARFGSRLAILTVLLIAIVISVLVAFTPTASEHSMLLTLLCLQGFFILGAQGSLYVLAAHVYPASARSTGIGATAGVGRAGAVVSAYAGSGAVALGSTFFFLTIAGCLTITLIAIACLRAHSAKINRKQA